MKTIRLTAAQAMARYLTVQMNAQGEPFLAGIWGIFGHGNVAGLGEALYGVKDKLPTYRGHNEQTMAHTAIAYAKQMRRKRAMAVTSSIGPGATNMITACALAHVNRLPVLFIPGDVFASRRPDPVLQQIEDFADGTAVVNDCFKPVARYYDRITRPEHILTALPRAFQAMTDPANCGPAVLGFSQDVQAEAYDYPVSFFEPKTWHERRQSPDEGELARVAEVIKDAKRPMILAGGGVLFSEAEVALTKFAEAHNIPVVETQAGKSSMPWDHPLNLGPVGVTGSSAANETAAEADVVIGVGTRFQDFTTGSWALFRDPDLQLISVNVNAYDAMKKGALPVQGDARISLERLTSLLADHKASTPIEGRKEAWFNAVDPLTAAPDENENTLPTDQQVIGAVQRQSEDSTVVMGAAGTMPGELHKLWKTPRAGGYHMEYGFSCMGYEVAGALGIKLAQPERDVICMLGDGSYMMANSELATAAMLGQKITLVLTDNRGFGCINRLQMGTGGAEFNNLLKHSLGGDNSAIDFAAHAAAQGATAVHVRSIAELEGALKKRHDIQGPYVVVIDTDPYPVTEPGGHWWHVGIPEVSERDSVVEAHKDAEDQKKLQYQG